MLPPYKIMQVGRGAVDGFIRKHYLHRWPGVVVCTLALVHEGLPIGCIVFALPPRETMKRYGVKLAWELARLFIEDVTPKNAESWFVARSVAWIAKHRPDVECLISYADPAAGHIGTIYKAGSWIQDGMTDQERNTPRFDYSSVVPKINQSLFDAADCDTKIYSRRSHVPDSAPISRVARVSKFRYVYWLDGSHEKKRQAARVAAMGVRA